jgi:hypothetical protein
MPGMWGDPDGNVAHGLNERLEVAALYTGRDFLSELVALCASKWLVRANELSRAPLAVKRD